MKSTYILIVCVVFAGIILTSFYFFNRKTSISNNYAYANATVPVIQNFNENQVRILSDNPDLIFNDSGWIRWYPPEKNYYTTIPVFNSDSKWYRNGAGYFSGSIPPESNHKGIIGLSPDFVDIPAGIGQNITLPNGNLALFVSYANLAPYFTNDSDSCNCLAGVIRIKIIDYDTKNAATIFEDVVFTNESWKDVALDISKYADKNIAFQAEGWGDSPCGFCGVFPFIDKFYIATLS